MPPLFFYNLYDPYYQGHAYITVGLLYMATAGQQLGILLLLSKIARAHFLNLIFVGSPACAANHYVIAEKFPYVQSSSGVDLANRCRITRSLSFRKIVV